MPAGRVKDAWRDERVAREYEDRRFRGPLRRLKHRRDERLVLELLGSLAGARRVLDLACGTGRLLPALQAKGYLVAGADVSPAMLRASGERRREGSLGFVQADAERLPFRSGAFDAAVSLRFLFHLTEGERRSVLAELGRVTGAGGVIGQVRYRWTAKHLSRWLRHALGLCARYRPSQDRQALERELAAADLELVRFRPISRWFSDKALFLARSHGVRSLAAVS